MAPTEAASASVWGLIDLKTQDPDRDRLSIGEGRGEPLLATFVQSPTKSMKINNLSINLIDPAQTLGLETE
jgi:hypothetical protein